MRSVVSSPASTCHRRYKVDDGDPSTTLALDRLAVQRAVNVVSTWWASEGRRRRGGRGRRADAGTHTYHLRAHTCTHHQLSSRHPTPAAAAVYMGQDLHTSSGNTVGTTTTYGSPPYYVSHQHTHTPALSVSHVDLIALRQRLRSKSHTAAFDFRSAATTTEAQQQRQPQTQHHHQPHSPPLQVPPHSPAPTNPTSTLPLQYLWYTRPAPGFEPREVTQPRPLRPRPKGCGWRGLISH